MKHLPVVCLDCWETLKKWRVRCNTCRVAFEPRIVEVRKLRNARRRDYRLADRISTLEQQIAEGHPTAAGILARLLDR
jgi:predicted amidophosphoribosyltransferase